MEAGPRPLAFDLQLPRLPLESGGSVDPLWLRGTVWGPPSDRARLEGALLPSGAAPGMQDGIVRRDAPRTAPRATRFPLDPGAPTVLLLHALTGDACPGGEGGWWSPVVGAGAALDPSERRIVCFNNLGSCYGTSGPGTPGYARDVRITTWDQARAILAGLDALGIERVELATGGSLGGMIALCLAALAPYRFERIAPIAATEQASAWLIGLNHVQREAIRLDPTFPEDGRRGLEVARQLAMLSYRAEDGLQQRQGRRQAGPATGFAPANPYLIETYLEHQGAKLARRFDVHAYLTQLGAMDHHDLSRLPGDLAGVEGLDRIRASALVVSIDSDVLFWPVQARRLAARLAERGRFVQETQIESAHGHDAFLIEWPQLDRVLRQALALPRGST